MHPNIKYGSGLSTAFYNLGVLDRRLTANRCILHDRG